MSVVTLGEAMIRLTPPNFARVEQTTTLQVTVGGSEWNTATGLARLGLDAKWVSALPKNSLGLIIANKAREQGVDVSHILWRDSGRVGIYFTEMGASPRASSVLYDRAASTISQVKPGDFNWKEILRGAALFHTTGITLALSQSCCQATVEAIEAAKGNSIPISFDLNYRAKLWSPKEAREGYSQVLPMIDILFTTSDDLEIVFGLAGDHDQVAREIAELFQIKLAVITIREAPTVLRGTWHSLAYSNGKVYETAPIELELIDRIGSGDAFNAGFLYCYLKGGTIEESLAYGDAMSALKHSISGDVCWVTLQEVEKFQAGRVTKIQR